MRRSKAHAWHINDTNQDVSDAFVQLASETGLTHSKALETAVLTWLREHGVWIFADPAPGRMTLITPITPGDFEPYYEWAEVSPYVDRWVSPPRVVLDDTDGMDPVE